MKETALSICERNFILNAASESKRLDGRKLDEFRNLNIYFGNDWGLCYTSLGETRVITQVSCEVQQPKTTRPNEGLLFINVEVSPMAAAHIEQGRSSDVSTHLNRLLEKCIKDSKAVDLESLCLIAEEKVWAIRVDVNILNHDGNLIQAASVSSLAALAHFKRPDVTTNGEEIIINDISERDPIPLTLHHYPVCITFALLSNGENVLADPTSIEERISDAALIFGINAYGEICGLHLGGNALVEPTLILKYSRKAAIKAKEIVDTIKNALSQDSEARQSNKDFGLVESIHWDKIKSSSEVQLKVQLNKFTSSPLDVVMDDESTVKIENGGLNSQIIDLGDNCAELVPLKSNDFENCHLLKEESMDEEHKELSENQAKVIRLTDSVWSVEKFGQGGTSKWVAEAHDIREPTKESNISKSKYKPVTTPAAPEVTENIDISGDSEEEIMILEAQDIENPVATSKSTKSKSEKQNKVQKNDFCEFKGNESKNNKKKNVKKSRKK